MKKSVLVKLPTIFKPDDGAELKRFGNKRDGGYVVDQRDLRGASALTSFGLSDDWSFEKSVWRRFGLPIYVYDQSAGSDFLKRRIAESLKNPFSFGRIFRRIMKYFSYHLFFRLDRVHYRQFVGCMNKKGFVSYSDVLETFSKGENSVFVKMDIEGCEYEILDQILLYAKQISGLAIEFHDCGESQNRIANFMESFPLRLVHVHANNSAGLSSEGFPNVLELTFSSSKPTAKGLFDNQNHKLDYPNSRYDPDIIINFTSN